MKNRNTRWMMMVLLMSSTTLSMAQTTAGAGIGGSPRNTGAVVLTSYGQLDVWQPEETIVHMGIGAQASYEVRQAFHAVPYAYAGLQLRDIYVAVRAGASYTIHQHEELKANMGSSRWFSYVGLHIDWINERTAGAFTTLNVSPGNWIDLSLGIRFTLNKQR